MSMLLQSLSGATMTLPQSDAEFVIDACFRHNTLSQQWSLVITAVKVAFAMIA